LISVDTTKLQLTRMLEETKNEKSIRNGENLISKIRTALTIETSGTLKFAFMSINRWYQRERYSHVPEFALAFAKCVKAMKDLEYYVLNDHERCWKQLKKTIVDPKKSGRADVASAAVIPFPAVKSTPGTCSLMGYSFICS
jgi:hypothetical protein